LGTACVVIADADLDPHAVKGEGSLGGGGKWITFIMPSYAAALGGSINRTMQSAGAGAALPPQTA
jgi:hypothetical protein